MPTSYTEHLKKWLELSDVDYIGPFVKAWLAYNAWYRSVYNHRTDRAILDDFRWNPNIIRNKIVPLMRYNSEEAEQFRAYIGDLHHRLERCHIHSTHAGRSERITFKNVYLKTRAIAPQTMTRYGWVHTVTPGAGSSTTLAVLVAKGSNIALQLNQQKYDMDELLTNGQFMAMSANQRGTLLSIYSNCNPRVIVDLTACEGPAQQFGAYQFEVSDENLFAGVCELIYSLRCSLFHGELIPDSDTISCYEPAYRIIRRFLSCI